MKEKEDKEYVFNVDYYISRAHLKLIISSQSKLQFYGFEADNDKTMHFFQQNQLRYRLRPQVGLQQPYLRTASGSIQLQKVLAMWQWDWKAFCMPVSVFKANI